MVIPGSIRNPDEADALSVKLSISDTEITMRADGTELGNWPSTDVSIRRIDSTSFEFIAEGDRLIFLPDDPATFGHSPLIGGRAASTGSRKGRKPKEKPSKPSRRDRKAAAEAARAETVRSPQPDEVLSSGPKEKRNRAWIRALDTARRYDIFGLDRVPIDEGLRGQEHQHTWDHRVAASYGPGKHICTICGRIRR